MSEEFTNESFENQQQNELVHIHNGSFRVPIATDCDGNEIIKDFAELPHLLVCGHSGTGKTSFVQSIMTLIAIDHSSTELKFAIYDSKSTDYTDFNHLSHMLMPVTNEERRFTGLVQWAKVEILKRYKAFSEIQVKDLESYNRKNKPLPHLFIIIDDLFNLLNNTTTSDTIDAIKYILLHGRQAGVHCIILTSNPSSKVFQKEILPNLPIKTCFAVVSKAESKAVLGFTGAEQLAVPGEMIFRTQNQFEKCRALYMAEDEIRDMISALDDGNTKPDSSIIEWLEKENTTENKDPGFTKYDEKLPSAVEIVLEMGTCSVSMLQRRMKISYSRTAQIIDQMEELGIVGPYEGAKPRSVIIDRAGWILLCKRFGLPQQYEYVQISANQKEDDQPYDIEEETLDIVEDAIPNDDDKNTEDNQGDETTYNSVDSAQLIGSDLNETNLPPSPADEISSHSNTPIISTKSFVWIRTAWVVGIAAVLIVLISFIGSINQIGKSKGQPMPYNSSIMTEQKKEQGKESEQNKISSQASVNQIDTKTIVIPAHLVYDGSTQEEYDHFATEYGLKPIEKGADGSITLNSDKKIPNGNVDALVAVLSEKCGKPGYTHFVSIRVSEDITGFTIVVNDVNMSVEEKQAVTDLFLMAGIHAIQSEKAIQNIQIVTMNMLGTVLSERNTNK